MKSLALFLLVFALATSVISAQPVVVIVRHAEKLAAGGNDPDLSPAGRTRAENLARILKEAKITAIFTSEFKRTQETAAPTAKEAQVLPTIVPAKDTASVVAKLRAANGTVLVVGHGDTIPNLLKSLGIDMEINIPDNDYTELFVITPGEKPHLLRLHYPS
jgi:broad specificity phosphatase PhoE